MLEKLHQYLNFSPVVRLCLTIVARYDGTLVDWRMVSQPIAFWEVNEGSGTSIELLDDWTAQSLSRVLNKQAAKVPLLLSADQIRFKSFFASNLLYITGISLSKLCSSCEYLRLTPCAIRHRASHALLGMSELWLLASILTICVNCELNQPWSGLTAQ